MTTPSPQQQQQELQHHHYRQQQQQQQLPPVPPPPVAGTVAGSTAAAESPLLSQRLSGSMLSLGPLAAAVVEQQHQEPAAVENQEPRTQDATLSGSRAVDGSSSRSSRADAQLTESSNSTGNSSSSLTVSRLQGDLSSLMQQADHLLTAPPTDNASHMEMRRQAIEALTASITATTASLRAHSAAAAASNAVLEHERRVVAAAAAVMNGQAAVLRQREAALLLQVGVGGLVCKRSMEEYVQQLHTMTSDLCMRCCCVAGLSYATLTAGALAGWCLECSTGPVPEEKVAPHNVLFPCIQARAVRSRVSALHEAAAAAETAQAQPEHQQQQEQEGRQQQQQPGQEATDLPCSAAHHAAAQHIEQRDQRYTTQQQQEQWDGCSALSVVLPPGLVGASGVHTVAVACHPIDVSSETSSMDLSPTAACTNSSSSTSCNTSSSSMTSVCEGRE